MFDPTHLHVQPAAETHIGRLHITPDVTNWTITVETFINGPFLGTALDLCLVVGKTLALQMSGPVEQPDVTCTFELPDPGPAGRAEFLWTPERPALLDLTLTLRRDATILHTIEGYTALLAAETPDGEPYRTGRPHIDLELHPALLATTP
jgi:hypothetical protein